MAATAETAVRSSIALNSTLLSTLPSLSLIMLSRSTKLRAPNRDTSRVEAYTA
nr:hypothetical protein [Aeropyrum camini]